MPICARQWRLWQWSVAGSVIAAHALLELQGWHVNQKKRRRLYREEKLQVRKRGGRKRALSTRRPMLVPEWPNERWRLDFVSDAFTDGRRFRVLAIVNDISRE